MHWTEKKISTDLKHCQHEQATVTCRLLNIDITQVYIRNGAVTPKQNSTNPVKALENRYLGLAYFVCFDPSYQVNYKNTP